MNHVSGRKEQEETGVEFVCESWQLTVLPRM